MSDSRPRRADWLEISEPLVDFLRQLREKYTESEFQERTGVRARTFATWERRLATKKKCLVSARQLVTLFRHLDRSPTEFDLPQHTREAIDERLRGPAERGFRLPGRTRGTQTGAHRHPSYAGPSPVQVLWLNRVRTQLPKQTQDHVGSAFGAAYREAADLRAIVVCDRLVSHPHEDKPELLSIELVTEDRSFPRIVKIDDAEGTHHSAMQREYEAWAAVKGFLDSPDVVFASLADPSPDQSRQVLEYDVASRALRSPEVATLEELVLRSVRFGTPAADSIVRGIWSTFEHLAERLYSRGRRCGSAQVAEFYRARLQEPIKTWWRPERVTSRRPVLLKLGCRPEKFQDPVDWLNWLLSSAGKDCVPECLFGPCHGDLHGRNVLCGNGDEAADQAIYDYEALSVGGPVACDLARLELDLRVRTMPHVADIRGKSEQGIEQLAEFERQLYERTKELDGYPLGPITGDLIDAATPEPWRRLFAILLEIRQSARACLGRGQRPECWKEEYLFTLAAHCVEAAGDGAYDPVQQKMAYVAGGVAAAHFASEDCHCPRRCPREICRADAPWGKDTRIGALAEPFGVDGESLFPNYVVAMAVPQKRAQSRSEHDVREAVAALANLHLMYPHAAAVEREWGLAKIELSSLVAEAAEVTKLRNEAEKTLEALRSEFPPDVETLGKLGRLHKEYAWAVNKLGDEQTEAAETHYRRALEYYQTAYKLDKHYYPGINVAMLHLVLGNEEDAKRVAEEVLKACAELKPEDLEDVDERTWVEATRAEAYLILEQYEAAAKCYDAAMNPDLTKARAESPRRHARCILAKLPDSQAKQAVREVLGIPRPKAPRPSTSEAPPR